jgi:uncharacterized protein YeeX (DUF496 family)
MVNLATDSLPEVMQGDRTRPAGGDDEQKTSDERKFIQGVLDSMADDYLDVLSKEEIEEIILEMERAVDEKTLPAIPLPDVP